MRRARLVAFPLLLVLVLAPLNSSCQDDYLASGGQARSSADRYAAEEEAELEVPVSAGSGCPSECACNRATQTADCSNRKLLRVPSSFPKDIKRIRLDRNNISEIGAYAFRGLKKLQRIDLSNNNLIKIDPLALAGLQSLNSLILYSNKLSQLPAGLFNDLSQLQLLLLNANSLKCVSKQLFNSLNNLNLLSLYDNSIETLANGTFEGLRSIKTIHLGKNPLLCDCNLRWLADYLESNPIETSEARCERPNRNRGKKFSELSKQKFRCEANEESRSSLAAAQCDPPEPSEASGSSLEDQSCPSGCQCDGTTIDCSPASQSESRAAPPALGALYELPDIPEDVPVYVTRVKFNDNRIKRIRQTSLFRRLASSRKLDLGGSKIVDIEDNFINTLTGAPGSGSRAGQQAATGPANGRPERVVFVLLENDRCDSSAPKSPSLDQYMGEPNEIINTTLGSACAIAAKVKPDGPCFNGGSCVPSAPNSLNFSCLCQPGFAGPLCETNVDDCIEHQCQNGAACVDGVNSYRCICRDPTTSGEFCEQLNPLGLAPMNLLGAPPVALPMVSSPLDLSAPKRADQPQISARSADPISAPMLDLAATPSSAPDSKPAEPNCRRTVRKNHIIDGDCQSARAIKLSSCESADASCPGCCVPVRTKQRRVRMQCSDGATYVKTVEIVKKCSCTSQCSATYANQDGRQRLRTSNGASKPGQSDGLNATLEDQALQTSRLNSAY